MKFEPTLTVNAAFAAKLRELREAKPLTQRNLAKILGVSRSAYANYENGRASPPFWFAERVAAFFNAPLNDLTKENQ